MALKPQRLGVAGVAQQLEHGGVDGVVDELAGSRFDVPGLRGQVHAAVSGRLRVAAVL